MCLNIPIKLALFLYDAAHYYRLFIIVLCKCGFENISVFNFSVHKQFTICIFIFNVEDHNFFIQYLHTATRSVHLFSTTVETLNASKIKSKKGELNKLRNKII